MSSTDDPADSQVDTDSLLERARGGDQRAFEALYRETCGGVHGLCLRLTANRALAEECVQQTYIQAWRNLSSFRGASSVSTWLYRIAVNEVNAQYRRESRHALDTDLDLAVAPASDTGGILDLERAVASLPDRARAVFVLVGVYGYPHEEAAALLDMAVGTSKAHYHHARQALKALLGDSA
ncbi:MAG: RNA polymerase sigma factor [Pseudomonadales bacterium]